MMRRRVRQRIGAAAIGGLAAGATLASAHVVAASAELDCSRERPIEGYDNVRMVTVPLEGNAGQAAEEVALQRAQAELADRLLGGNSCGRADLMAAIQPYGRGRNAHSACAQAVIHNDDWAKFRAKHRDIDAGLAAFREGVKKQVAPAIAHHLDAQAAARSGPVLRLAVLPYPAQEEVLRLLSQQVHSALGSMTPWDPAWPAEGIPPGVDAVIVPQWSNAGAGEVLLGVEARIRSKLQQPYAVSVLGNIVVSKCLLPEPAPLPAASQASVRLELTRAGAPAAPGEGFCSGDAVDAVLVSQASAPLHVRVVDLWGHRDGAMVVWPQDANDSDVLQPGQHLRLVPEGVPMVLVSTSVPLERFAVVSAPSASTLDALLGPLATTMHCRMPAPAARQLHALRSGPANGYAVAMTEVKFIAGGRCGTSVDLSRRVQAEKQFKQMPVCR